MIQKHKNKRIQKFKELSFNNSPILFLLYSSIFLLPQISFAFAVDLKDFIQNYILNIFDLLLPLLNGAAFLLFFYGMAKFILSAGNEKELAEGRQFMIWGILALFILVSFWAIIQFWSTQLGFGTVTKFQYLPQ